MESHKAQLNNELAQIRQQEPEGYDWDKMTNLSIARTFRKAVDSLMESYEEE